MMKTLQRSIGDETTTVLGPCPGCGAWQLDYTNDVAHQFAILGFDGARDEDLVTVSLHPFYAVIEDALQEHLAECPHLRDLVDAL